jgi:hypothetical protein
MSFDLVNLFINSCVVVDAARIVYVGFENAACQFVETHCKYFRVEGKGSTTKERIHDGGTRERRRISLCHIGRQGER